MATISHHAPPFGRRSVSESEWRAALWRACSEDDLIHAAYQPVVDLQSAAVQGFEVLARFPDEPKGGPEAWFAAAARHGLEGVLAAFIVRGALGVRHALGGRFLAVNVTPRALVAAEVQTAFRSSGELTGVVVEVTEQSALGAYDELNAALTPLRALGAAVAVDDADSGYASLRQIAALRPDFVKVHQALVAGVDTDEAKATVVRTLQDFSATVGARLVAEGVERVEELDTLLDLGVGLGQGFALGRPQATIDELDSAVASFIRSRATATRRPSERPTGLATATGWGPPAESTAGGAGSSMHPVDAAFGTTAASVSADAASGFPAALGGVGPADGAAGGAEPPATPAPHLFSLLAPVGLGDGHQGLVDRFLADPGLQYVAVVDAVGQPTGLAVRAATLRGEPPAAPLVVSPATPVATLAGHVRGRPLQQRNHPLVVCDAVGRYVGLAPIAGLLGEPG